MLLARSPPQSGPTAAESELVPSAPPAAPRTNLITAEVLERQREMCQLLASVVGTLEAINDTLKV